MAVIHDVIPAFELFSSRQRLKMPSRCSPGTAQMPGCWPEGSTASIGFKDRIKRPARGRRPEPD